MMKSSTVYLGLHSSFSCLQNLKLEKSDVKLIICSNEPWKVVWRQDTIPKVVVCLDADTNVVIKFFLLTRLFFITFRVLQVSRVVLPLLWPARYYLSPTFG